MSGFIGYALIYFHDAVRYLTRHERMI